MQASSALEQELRAVLSLPTGRTSSGWPYLARPAWERLRDWVPHTLGEGSRVWDAVAALEATGEVPEDGVRVVRQVVRTAVVTAPPDLWLLRHVLSALVREGWTARLVDGVSDVPPELEPDLVLLLARGYLVRWRGGYRWAEEPTAQRVLHELEPLPIERPLDLSARWAAALSGDRSQDALLADVLAELPADEPHPPPAWVAGPADLEVGYRLVPLVLGLRASGRIPSALAGTAHDLLSDGPLAQAAAELLVRAGWARPDGAWTAPGRRGLERGPGPFGIIETYHPYLAELPRIWREGRRAVHVQRAANVAASQDANRATFERANDALDRFCEETGFRYTVFVEHAVGRGEATRQRFARSGAALAYVGADLEAAAIDEARAQQAAGHLPDSMRFVQADIGEPQRLVEALHAHGLSADGAVMLVGNGFHEVRGQTDERMIEVFRGYERAGVVLLFTEESALAADDLLATAWNTYHAGFRYVHERSGQGLRPAAPRPPAGLGPPLRASWTECASQAGYVRATRWSWRSRSIFPYPPPNGHNPSVSANHFFVPGRLAIEVGLASEPR